VKDNAHATFARSATPGSSVRLRLGLPIGFATDAQVIPHGQNAKEFAIRVKLGEAPMATIVSATSLNAEIMGWKIGWAR
jgi:imidazolonepropionase-like amidohydrolase